MVRRANSTLPEEMATGFARNVLESVNQFQWLDRTDGWFWYGAQRSTPLISRIKKVLSVCDWIRVAELRVAIRRDHHIRRHIPPTTILLDICRQLPGIRIEDDRITKTEQMDYLKLLRGDEARLVDLLIKNGPVCRRETLQKAAAAIGMGLPSFWRCIQFCPTICRYAPNVYGLTGAHTDPATIEILGERNERRRVVQDHGWTNDGDIWIAYQMSAPTLDSGVFAIPAAKRDLLQGRYDIIGPNDQKVGNFVVTNESAWGMGPFLRRSGAEPGDWLLTIFNTSKKTINVRLGDESLVDELTN